MSLKLNLPPEYLLIHRVWLGGLGVLCQIQGEVPAGKSWTAGSPAPTSPLRPHPHANLGTVRRKHGQT